MPHKYLVSGMMHAMASTSFWHVLMRLLDSKALFASLISLWNIPWCDHVVLQKSKPFSCRCETVSAHPLSFPVLLARLKPSTTYSQMHSSLPKLLLVPTSYSSISISPNTPQRVLRRSDVSTNDLPLPLLLPLILRLRHSVHLLPQQALRHFLFGGASSRVCQSWDSDRSLYWSIAYSWKVTRLCCFARTASHPVPSELAPNESQNSMWS